jgi:uncharacterized delta-60 repeat protein
MDVFHPREVPVFTSRRHARTIVIAMAAVWALVGHGAAVALVSDTDPAFGTGGSTTVAVGGSASVSGIVQRDDGSFIIGTSVNASFMTVALMQGGDPLTTYGSSGISSTPIPGMSSVGVADVALQPDGRVVLAGFGYANTGSDRFVVARFRAGGAPDPSFSGNGVYTTRFSQGDAYGYGVTIQHDGRIVVVGEVDASANGSNPAILRLDPDGTPDSTFGHHGRLMVKVPDGHQGYDSPWRVVAQANGKLAMSGWLARPSGSNYKTLVMRLRSNGSLDPTFSGDGWTAVDVDGTDNYAYGMDTDGSKIVLGVHTSASDAGFVRLNADGTRDSTFDGDGVVTYPLSVNWEVRAVVVAPDHRIIGVNGFSSGPNIAVLKPHGNLDTGYSSDGEGVGPISNAIGEGLLLLGNGKVVVVGTGGADVIATRFFAP